MSKEPIHYEDWLELVERRLDMFVTLPGLDNHQIALRAHDAYFLEEGSVNGTRVTNVHFSNGRFVSILLPIEELKGLLSGGNRLGTEEEEKQVMEKMRRRAEERRLAKLAVEETIRESGLYSSAYKKASHTIETLADGSKRIVVDLEPAEDAA